MHLKESISTWPQSIAARASAYPHCGCPNLVVQSRGAGVAISSLDLSQLELLFLKHKAKYSIQATSCSHSACQ